MVRMSRRADVCEPRYQLPDYSFRGRSRLDIYGPPVPLPPCPACDRPRFWAGSRTAPHPYCDPECQRAAMAARARESRAVARAARPAQNCAHCGEFYVPSRSDSRYCSGRCRVAVHRAVRS